MTDTPSIIQPTPDTEILFALVDPSFFSNITLDKPIKLTLTASVNESVVLSRDIHPNHVGTTIHEQLGLTLLNNVLLELYQTLSKYTVQQAAEIDIEIKLYNQPLSTGTPTNITHYLRYNGLDFWHTIHTRDIDPLYEQDVD